MSQRPSLLCFYQVSETRAQMLGFHYSLGPLPLHTAGITHQIINNSSSTTSTEMTHQDQAIHRDVHVRLWTNRAVACRHNAMKIMEIERFLQKEATYQKFGLSGYVSEFPLALGQGLGRREGGSGMVGDGVSVDGYAYGLQQQGQQGQQGLTDGGAGGGGANSSGGGQEPGFGSGYPTSLPPHQICHLPFAPIAGGVGCIAGRGSVAVVHQIWSLLAASLELLALTLSLSLGKDSLVN